VAETLPGVSRVPGGAAFDWAAVVEEMRELWPIQYLLPGGAFAGRR